MAKIPALQKLTHIWRCEEILIKCDQLSHQQPSLTTVTHVSAIEQLTAYDACLRSIKQMMNANFTSSLRWSDGSLSLSPGKSS